MQKLYSSFCNISVEICILWNIFDKPGFLCQQKKTQPLHHFVFSEKSPELVCTFTIYLPSPSDPLIFSFDFDKVRVPEKSPPHL